MPLSVNGIVAYIDVAWIVNSLVTIKNSVMKKVSISLVATLAIVFAVMSSFRSFEPVEKWFPLDVPTEYSSFISNEDYLDFTKFDHTAEITSFAAADVLCGEAVTEDLVCALRVVDQDDDDLDADDLDAEYGSTPPAATSAYIVFKTIE